MQYTINNSYNSTYILKLWNVISKHNIIIDRWADLLSYEAMRMNDHDEKLLKEKIKENIGSWLIEKKSGIKIKNVIFLLFQL